MNNKSKLEEYLKENQFTISTIGIIVSFFFSIGAFYFSYNADQLSKKQEIHFTQPSFSFKFHKNDSTTEVDAIEFISLKENIQIESINIFFPSEFQEDTILNINESTWYLNDFKDLLLSIIESFHHQGKFQFQSIHVDKLSIPIIVRFNYVSDFQKKHHTVFYLMDILGYNKKTIRVKNLSFQKSISNTTEYVSFLNTYNNIIGYNVINFSNYHEVDSIINYSNANNFYRFISQITNSKCISRILITDNESIIDSIDFYIPTILIDSVSYSAFSDSLIKFKKILANNNKIVKNHIARLDSFFKLYPPCFDKDCIDVTPWKDPDTFEAFHTLVAKMKIEFFINLNKRNKKYSHLIEFL